MSIAVLRADEGYRSRRDERYKALRTIWRISEVKRLATCRRVGTGDDIVIRVNGTPGEPGARAGISGLQTCGSVWACPVCSEIVNSERQAEVARALDHWLADSGRSVSFVTLTLQHSRRDGLTELWDAIADGWRKLTASVAWRGGKTVQGIRSVYGVEHVLRAAEVKHGKHGWHPHLHILLFHDRVLENSDRERLRHDLYGKWSSVLGKAGYRALEFDQDGHAVGVDVQPVKSSRYVSEYLTKHGYRPVGTAAAGAAYEVTGSHSKKLGKGGRTAFEILAEIVAHADDFERLGDSDSWVVKRTGELVDTATVRRSQQNLILWREWEQASKGRRQLTWSRGLRAAVGLDTETDDAEVVDNVELLGEPVDLGGEPIRYNEFCQYLRPLISDLLGWAETGELPSRLAQLRAKRRKQDNRGCQRSGAGPGAG